MMRLFILLVFFTLNAQAAKVWVLDVQEIIHPVVSNYIESRLNQAEKEQVSLVVIRLNTPGGLMTATRSITTAMTNATMPVCVYVAPSGAQAASAGFFILMASDIAAMAPTTNTGAAHPVNLGGGGGKEEGKDTTMMEKVVNDAAAYIRTLAESHHRNVDYAEKAVRESISFTEKEALQNHLIEYIATDIHDLLKQLSGKKFKDEPLDLKNSIVVEKPMSFAEKFLSKIAHPNIAYLLMLLGMLGIYVEITHPGTVLPGVIGALSILLAFYALHILPVNYVGVALLFLAIILFILEIKITSYGLLTIGGLISFILGSLMLFDTNIPALRVSYSLIITMGLIVFILVAFLTTLAIRAHRSKVATGEEGLIGERGTASTDLAPKGKIFLHGEYWNAWSDTPIPKGATVEVTGTKGMVLKVIQVQEEV